MLVRKPHREASPIPAGVPKVHWYRCFNSAHSAIYNAAGKDKTVNAAVRKLGETRLRAFEEVNRRVIKGVFQMGPEYIGRDTVERSKTKMKMMRSERGAEGLCHEWAG